MRFIEAGGSVGTGGGTLLETLEVPSLGEEVSP
jgi:hypothetical protein